ncbi:MAG: hypothetical protein KDA73_10490 [Rhodobacteraceae bacterium]|nr:hypothetical protein [Paracoccaceae bacterium]
MIATVTIGTVGVQGVLVRLLPAGQARVAVRGRVFRGRLVTPPKPQSHQPKARA